MVQSGEVWFYFGIWMYVTVLTHSEMPPDLGPIAPSFETCETMECPENSECVDNKADFVSCVCSPGKTGANCTLEDPCLERKTDCPAGSLCFGDCPPNVICEGATGISHCRGCVTGWTGMRCEECDAADNPCLNDGTCQDTNGGFHCTCKEGWTGKTCDCKKGTSCDVGEIKTAESKDGKGSQLFCSFVIPFLPVFMYAMLTI